MIRKDTPVDETVRLYEMGMNDSEVIRRLKEEGYTPVQISDALNQAKIKMEILSSEPREKGLGESEEGESTNSAFYPFQMHSLPPKKMHEEIPAAKEAPKAAVHSPHSAPSHVPRPTAVPPAPKRAPTKTSPAMQPERRHETPYPEENLGYPYNYPTYEEEHPQKSKADTEKIEEIAEEVVNEKWQEIKEKVNEVFEWKEFADKRITAMDERLKRIEASVDNLQAALLSKVNEYGRGIKELSSEMASLEGAMGKVLSPLTDNVRELGSLTEEFKTAKAKRPKSSSKKSKKR